MLQNKINPYFQAYSIFTKQNILIGLHNANRSGGHCIKPYVIVRYQDETFTDAHTEGS